MIKLANNTLEVNQSKENYDKFTFEHLGVDSVELLMGIEKHFNIKIPIVKPEFFTLNLAVEYILNNKN